MGKNIEKPVVSGSVLTVWNAIYKVVDWLLDMFAAEVVGHQGSSMQDLAVPVGVLRLSVCLLANLLIIFDEFKRLEIQLFTTWGWSSWLCIQVYAVTFLNIFCVEIIQPESRSIEA